MKGTGPILVKGLHEILKEEKMRKILKKERRLMKRLRKETKDCE